MRVHDSTRVVIVDHSPELIDVLSLLAQELGYEVETACESVQALELIETRLPRCVILDATMPRVKGELLSQILRRRYADRILIIAFSGYPPSRTEVGATFEIADYSFSKPFDFEQLESCLPSLA